MINGMIYVGQHMTNDLNDGYLGSGRSIRAAISEFGKQNFKKDILHICKSFEEMDSLERQIVNEDFVARSDTYNNVVGGYRSGLDHKISRELNRRGRTAADSVILEKYGVANAGQTARARIRSSEVAKQRMKNKDDPFLLAGRTSFLGKAHSSESKRKMSETQKERLKDPTKNSQFGTMWITDGTENRKIKKTDTVPEGWSKGRKC